MPRASLLAALCLALSLLACGPKTLVVLVPDDDNHVGTVQVATATASQTLDTANASVVVTDKPSEVRTMDQAAIEAQFGPALAAQPARPQSYLLYFGHDATDPLPDSKALLPEIARMIKTRPLAEVSIIGHSDQTGDQEHNLRLSLARAEAIKALLQQEGVEPQLMRVEGYGPNDPLVPTAPGVAEPRNRRVEVFMR